VIARSPDKNESVRAIAGNRRGAGGVEREAVCAAPRVESNEIGSIIFLSTVMSAFAITAVTPARRPQPLSDQQAAAERRTAHAGEQSLLASVREAQSPHRHP